MVLWQFKGNVQTALGVWRTTYLHTDGRFAAALPDLHTKLMDTFYSIDAEEWQLLVDKDRDKLHIRTIESHEYRYASFFIPFVSCKLEGM